MGHAGKAEAAIAVGVQRRAAGEMRLADDDSLGHRGRHVFDGCAEPGTCDRRELMVVKLFIVLVIAASAGYTAWEAVARLADPLTLKHRAGAFLAARAFLCARQCATRLGTAKLRLP